MGPTQPATGRREGSHRKALLLFFALAYGLSWTVWGSTLAQQNGLIGWRIPAEPFGFLAVSAAAVVTTAVFGGRPALRALGARLVRWRVAPRWYLVAIALPVVPAFAALGVHLVLGGQHDLHGLVPLSATLPLLATQLVTHLLTEELGWRGVALPHLRASLHSLPAGLMMGVLWAGWHIPMFFLPGTRQTYPFLGFVVLAVSVSVIMTWIWERTGGSVLIAALFHAAMNTGWAVLNVLWGDLLLFWLCAGFTAALGVAVGLLQLHDRTPPPTTSETSAPTRMAAASSS